MQGTFAFSCHHNRRGQGAATRLPLPERVIHLGITQTVALSPLALALPPTAYRTSTRLCVISIQSRRKYTPSRDGPRSAEDRLFCGMRPVSTLSGAAFNSLRSIPPTYVDWKVFPLSMLGRFAFTFRRESSSLSQCSTIGYRAGYSCDIVAALQKNVRWAEGRP